MKSKIIKIVVGVIVLVTIAIGVMYLIDYTRMQNGEEVIFSTWGNKYNAPTEKSENLNVALTLEDEITNDTVWCGTFQLIWNDLKNNLAKQDIIFTPQLKVVENLNKETFSTNDLSEEYYYKKIGTPSIQLKEEIESAIKEKFNENSQILDEFNWENSSTENYFLYVMLKKQFEFEKAFEELETGTFGNYSNVEYFGISKNSTAEQIRKQVEVLYYNDENDFAIKLKTKQEDEVILCKNPQGNTFNEIYQNIIYQEDTYEGLKTLQKGELLKIPNIQINSKQEFTEIENKPFLFSNGKEYIIEKSLQTIEFELDKTGGKIKSEAGMAVNEALFYDETREFALDNTFAIFLKENGKQNPYFAAKIDDISKFQIENNQIENNEQEEDKLVEMYEVVIDNLMETDTALNSDAKYISLDVDSLKGIALNKTDEYPDISESQKQQLLEYCKKYNENVKDLSFEELKEQGLVAEDFPYIEGVLIYISNIEVLNENSAVFQGIKYRSGLGAIFISYELKYKNGTWNINQVTMAIS